MVGGQGDGLGVGPNGIRNITTLPSVIAAGGRLTFMVEGCRNGGVASSRVFATTPLSPVGEAARGTVTIRPDARPGPYDITVNCDGRALTRPAALTVVGAVRGGAGGGTAAGATKADLAVGGGLVAAGVVGGGAFWLRRRPWKRL
ncbi:hypothetical protein ACF061_23285 [Streptomyces sp. NPDC015220]|uniref:hypothetical protein n=1 Tax=Streptomyces sp. NPDC015220 TaxID=3364947 RepID=UPI0036FFD3A7